MKHFVLAFAIMLMATSSAFADDAIVSHNKNNFWFEHTPACNGQPGPCDGIIVHYWATVKGDGTPRLGPHIKKGMTLEEMQKRVPLEADKMELAYFVSNSEARTEDEARQVAEKHVFK